MNADDIAKNAEVIQRIQQEKNRYFMTENDLSYLIRGAIFRVNTNVGPGLLESAYEMALCHELRKDGLEVQK